VKKFDCPGQADGESYSGVLRIRLPDDRGTEDRGQRTED
jgi:hypothetical protein